MFEKRHDLVDTHAVKKSTLVDNDSVLRDSPHRRRILHSS